MGRVQGQKALILMTKGEKISKWINGLGNHKKQVLVIICVIMRDGRGHKKKRDI